MTDSDTTVWVSIYTTGPSQLSYGLTPNAYETLVAWYRIGKERVHTFKAVGFPADDELFVALERAHIVGIQRQFS